MLKINSIDNIRHSGNFVIATIDSSNVFKDFNFRAIQIISLIIENASFKVLVEFCPRTCQLAVFGLLFDSDEGGFEYVSCNVSESEINMIKEWFKEYVIERIAYKA